jgi:Sec7-like guanine-nucleotide exchange factor
MFRNILTLRSQNDQAEAHKGYKVAVRNFNANPKKGIEYLVESKIVPNNPASIAKFLHTAEGLSKNQIGVYLGEK